MKLANAFFKITITALGFTTLMSLTTSFSKFCGLNYDHKKDFACCRANHLVVLHYYSFNVFFISVYNGFTEEKISSQSATACNMRCDG